MTAPIPAPEDSAEAMTPTSTPAEPDGKSRPAPRALVLPMHRILRIGGIAAAIALPAAALLGYLIAGMPGLWGGLLGIGIAVAFLAVTVIVGLATAGAEAAMLGFAVLGSWLIKIIVLIGVMAFLRGQDFYSRPVLFVSLLVGIAGTLFIEWRVVSTTKVPYVEPRAAS